MTAGAPYGNRNAEKWTFKKSIRLFNDAIDLTDEEMTIKIKVGNKITEMKGYKFDFIGEIARELKTFHEIFVHLKSRFPVLKRKYNTLINNLEQNCYSNTKKGIIKEATGLVNLKSNHKWTDRIDNTSGDQPIDNKVVVEFKNYSGKKKK